MESRLQTRQINKTLALVSGLGRTPLEIAALRRAKAYRRALADARAELSEVRPKTKTQTYCDSSSSSNSYSDK